MQGGAVSGVPLKAVTGKPGCQALKQAIPFLLGEHAGGGDRQTATVSRHQGVLAAVPTPQRQHPIHQQHRHGRQFPQGPDHGPFRGQPDAMAIDFGGTGLAQGPGEGPGADQRHQGCPAAGRELLAVGEACGSQGRQSLLRQADRSGEDRPEQGAAADLIDTDTVGGGMAGPGIRRWRKSGGGGGGVQMSRRRGQRPRKQPGRPRSLRRRRRQTGWPTRLERRRGPGRGGGLGPRR